MEHFWNERFGAPEYVYGTSPNAFFKSCLDKLSPGRVLLPAEGEGRNAVYAARQGWEAHAVDFSAAGREKALALALKNGVDIRYDIAGLDTFAFPQAHFHAAALIFAHMPMPLRRVVHQKIVQSLLPGGVLILEAFSPAQLAFQSGGPKTLELLYDLEEVLEDFSGMEVLSAEHTEIILDEGPYHQGRAAVVRIFAKKM